VNYSFKFTFSFSLVIFYKIAKSFIEENRDLLYIDWLPIVSFEKNNKVISPFSKKKMFQFMLRFTRYKSLQSKVGDLK